MEEIDVTFENSRNLDFYNSQEKLKDQMDYMYNNLISKEMNIKIFGIIIKKGILI